jgi:hypothetical protein
MRDSDEEPKLKRPAMPGAGRPLGALNKLTKDLKQAMLDGAVSSDYACDPDNEDAPGSLTQYMKTVANKHPELFFQAVSKLIPREIKTHLQQDTTIDVTYRTTEEVKTAMIDAGMSRKQIEMIEAMLPVPLEQDEEATPQEIGDASAD